MEESIENILDMLSHFNLSKEEVEKALNMHDGDEDATVEYFVELDGKIGNLKLICYLETAISASTVREEVGNMPINSFERVML